MSYDLEYGKYRNKPLAFLRDNDPDYSDAVYLAKRWPERFEVPNYFEHSEYGNTGILGQANYESWSELYGDLEGKNWWGMGDEGILVRSDLLTKDQKETLASLENYPLIDEDKHSQLEMDAQTEQWDDWGRSDFKREVVKLAIKPNQEVIEEMLDAMPDKLLDETVYELWRSSGQYPEGGDDVHFPSARRIFDRPSWEKEGEKGYIAPWDRTFEGLIMFFKPEEHPESFELDVTLSDAAFGPWKGHTRKLTVKPGDLPDPVRELARPHGPASITVPYSAEVCASPYVTCEWSFIASREAGEQRIKRRP